MIRTTCIKSIVRICFFTALFLFGEIECIDAQTVYRDSLFTSIEKTKHVYYSKTNEKLELDLFEPINNEDRERPVILYVHGGGFSGGERDHPEHEDFLKHFAHKGYVTATMSYTLQRKGKSFGCDVDADIKIDTFLETARDINRATAFLVQNRLRFAIDPSNIVVVGSSAGAEAALHAVYWNKTKGDSSATILPSTFRYGGVISMAGAVANINHISKESAVPTQLFHGTDDELVPFDIASHHYCSMDSPGFLMLFGAFAITRQLQKIDAGYYLISDAGGGHEWASKPLTDYRSEISDFLYHDVLLKEQREIHVQIANRD
jgi:predicted peptidase